MNFERITIIGLGLIGGSLARALREKLDFHGIKAVDADERSLESALNEGIIEKGFTGLDSSIYDSELIFICTPVKQAIRYIGELSPRIGKTCILTDVCTFWRLMLSKYTSAGG